MHVNLLYILLEEDEEPATSEECGLSEGPVTSEHGALEGSVISKDCATSNAASICFYFAFLCLLFAFLSFPAAF